MTEWATRLTHVNKSKRSEQRGLCLRPRSEKLVCKTLHHWEPFALGLFVSETSGRAAAACLHEKQEVRGRQPSLYTRMSCFVSTGSPLEQHRRLLAVQRFAERANTNILCFRVTSLGANMCLESSKTFLDSYSQKIMQTAYCICISPFFFKTDLQLC